MHLHVFCVICFLSMSEIFKEVRRFLFHDFQNQKRLLILCMISTPCPRALSIVYNWYHGHGFVSKDGCPSLADQRMNTSVYNILLSQ